MSQYPCPFCQTMVEITESPLGGSGRCPTCGESFSVPPSPPAPILLEKRQNNTGPGSGGVFAMGAVLLAAVVIAAVLFWNGLLKKRDVRPPKREEKKQGQRLFKTFRYFQLASGKPAG